MAVKKMPQSQPPVDQVSNMALVDPEPASVALLHHIDNALHALTTKWGYPPQVQRMHMDTTDADRYILCICPPSVRYVNVGVLAYGKGTVTLTGSGTSDTTTIAWENTFAKTMPFAEWTFGSGLIDDGAAAALSPALKIQSSASWSSVAARININPADVGSIGSPTGTILALAIIPIWEDIAV